MIKSRRNNDFFVPHNESIRAKQVRCIDADNRNIGVVDTSQALRMASERELDLVQVCPPDKSNIPTCKIIDYSKYKYEQIKRKKEAAKKQRECAVEIREIKFRPNTGYNDLKTKASKAAELLEDGARLKLTIVFKGREIQHQDVAKDTLTKFVELVPGLQLSSDMVLQGKFLSVMATKGKINDSNGRKDTQN